MMIYNIGQECSAQFNNIQCNSYLLTGEKNIIIDTVPNKYAKEYIDCIKKYIQPQKIHCVILTGAVPERAGCVLELLKYNPEIMVFASISGLRNLKEILNKSFYEHMCKNEEKIQIGDKEFQFFITPNLPNPDTIMVYSKELGALFGGEMYACNDDGISDVFYKHIQSVLPFAQNAHMIVRQLSPEFIYSSVGNNITDSKRIMSFYDSLSERQEHRDIKVLVVYTSLSENNMNLALSVESALKRYGLDCEVIWLDSVDPEVAADKLRTADALVLGTYTKSRTLPKPIWDFLSYVDVNASNCKPYFVFSSYGWSSEGAYISNEMLSLLKMRRVCKPVECTFTPSDNDFENINKAVEQLIKALQKERES